jgi:hypothetical protein
VEHLKYKAGVIILIQEILDVSGIHNSMVTIYSIPFYTTKMDGRLGMGLSHGCVRLDINNAKWIYDNIPRNTTVVVYN